MSVADAIKSATDAVDVNDAELDNLSLEELRALADGQAPKPKADAKTAVSKEEDEEEIDEEEEEDEEKFKREIDLGDGSGVQVFKAATLEKLLDKLAEAQKNATLKIRQQNEQLKKYKIQADAEAADNEYVVGQELMSKPTAAFKKLFKETTGVDIETFKTKWEPVEAFDKAQQVQAVENKKNDAANQFLAEHPEFIPNKMNGAKLEKAINLLVADAERTGAEVDFPKFLEEAFTDLSASGLLELKNEEAIEEPVKEAIEEPVKEAPPAPKPVQVAAHTRRASGLSSRARTATTPRNTEPTTEELYEMPLEKLKELAQKQGRS